MSFSAMASELQAHLRSNLPQVRLLLSRDPAAAYARIVGLGEEVGRRRGVRLVVNFPAEGRIREFGMYGRRDLSVIVDMSRRSFPVPRSEVRARAERCLGAETEDAYMYEGKEGARARFPGGRIDVLPHSLHAWCELTPEVCGYCDWLMEAVYGVR